MRIHECSSKPVRRAAALLCSALFILLALSTSVPASAAVTVTSHFIWTTTSSNVLADATVINNGTTNGAPNALLFVTPAYDAGGVCGCVTDSAPLGVEWASGFNKWVVINEDGSSMPVGASFNVLVVPRATSQVFVVTATAANTTANGTTINSTAINGNGNALLQVTHTMPAGSTNSSFNPHALGVVYGLGAGGNQWAIQNLDNAVMRVGLKFNVMVGAGSSNGGSAVLLTGTSTNTFGSDTFISNSETTGNPNAVVFDTQNADPGLHFGAGDKATTGVLYFSSPRDVMAVFNEKGSFMPTTTHYFNLLIFPS